MSEEEKRDVNKNSDSDDVEEIEDMESGNETLSSSNSSDVSQDSYEYLEDYVIEGTEIQPQDILVVQELPLGFSGQNSNESIASTVSYEFPNEFDDENCGSLCQSYLNNTPDFPEAERAECLVLRNQDTGPLEHDAALTNRSEHIKNINTLEELEGKRVPKLQMQCLRCEEKRSLGIPIIELALPQDGMDQLKCPEYASDEFADIEDNLKDSSSSDNNESPSTLNTKKLSPLKSLIPNFKSSQRQTADERKTLKKDGTSSSSSENCVLVDGVCASSFPSTSKTHCEFPSNYFSQNNCKDTKTAQATKVVNEGKKMFKVSMSTILELPEAENDGPSPANCQPPHSKPNSLKIKSRVGNRKDKCNICNVRLGLCAIRCRCGGYYCAKHRYDKEHDCSFDYKSMGAEEIRKNNPRIIAEKVRKL